MMHRRSISVRGLVLIRRLVLLLLFHGISAAAEIRVHDGTGFPLRLEQPAQRIVSLAPHVTELLYSAGAGARVVGAVDYSDYPSEARDLPRVGSAMALDIEAILALRPDLVVGWASGNQSESLQRLRTLGIALYLSEPRAIADVAADIERLGELAQTRSTADVVARELRDGYAALRQRYAMARPVTVFYQIWHQPLMTVGGGHIISRVIEDCGGRNVFAGLTTLAPSIDVEAVLAANPELIVAGGLGGQRPSWLDDWRRWPQLRAVRADALYFVDSDLLHRQTPRILAGMQQLCERIGQVRSQPGTTAADQPSRN